VRGKHTIGLGIDYRRWRLIRNLDDDFYGDWTFSGKTAPINTSAAQPQFAINGGKRCAAPAMPSPIC